GWGDDALAKYVEALKTQGQQLPVGATWAYNNAGFSILGRVIEVATGQTYEAAVADLVFKPLGLTDSFFFPYDVLTRRFAVGHYSTAAGPRVMHTWGLPRSLTPAGGIASSIRDQLAYARFHLGD